MFCRFVNNIDYMSVDYLNLGAKILSGEDEKNILNQKQQIFGWLESLKSDIITAKPCSKH